MCRCLPALVCRVVLCLQASGADNGQCLVHDVTAFHSKGIVDGLVNNVAAANISGSEEAPDAVKSLIWHSNNILLVGTEKGEPPAAAGDSGWQFDATHRPAMRCCTYSYS